MGVSSACSSRRSSFAAGDSHRQVVWHDLECGAYVADLPFWLGLARSEVGYARAPILEIGAGTGRVALALARAGYDVTAIDRDPALLAALEDRASGLAVDTVRADARSFELPHHSYGLCAVPMQTIQLFGGSRRRTEFLRSAREHLRADGLLACAIVTELESFDSNDGGIMPAPDTVLAGGSLYVSRPTRVHVGSRGIVIERERKVHPARLSRSGSATSDQPGERDTITLDRVSARQLEREGLAVGFTLSGRHTIDATGEHVGATVVMLRA